MVFYGADVDALRTLAALMERSAGTLNGAVGSVDGALMRATAWRGPAADRFRSQWSSTDRRQITGLALTLQEYARRLRTNADAQATASAASTGGAGFIATDALRSLSSWTSGLGSGVGTSSVAKDLLSRLGQVGVGVDPWQVLKAVRDANGQFEAIGKVGDHIDDIVRAAGGAKDLFAVARQLHTGSLSWDSAIGAVQTIAHDVHDGGNAGAMDVLDHAIESGTRSGSGWVDELAAVKGTSQVLKGVGEAVGKIGGLLSYGGAAISTAEVAGKLVNGTASASDVMNVVGTDLKTQPFGSPLYLTGVIASIGSTDANLLKQTDMSAGAFTNTMSYIGEHPDALGKGLVAGVQGIVKDIPGWFS